MIAGQVPAIAFEGLPQVGRGVVEHSGTHVWCRRYMAETECREAAEYLNTFLLSSRAVVDFVKPMAMEVDVVRHTPMLGEMHRAGDLGELFDKHRVLVCVGSGGVGKTTVSAALAMASAQSGRRTLCLTIDPARRLASSFGLESFPKEEVCIHPEFWRRHGLEVKGRLTVMMLDPKATFDDVIRRFSKSSEDSNKILNHRMYSQLAQSLSGTQAYMAMEKVLAVLRGDDYDLIVLDTPPNQRVLDFFDAPQRMSRILDSPATRALVSTLRSGRWLQLSLLGAGVRAAVSALQRITGGSLLVDVAEVLASMNSLFGGFESRAAEVDDALRSAEFGYVLVTSAASQTLDAAATLVDQMVERNLAVGAAVFNRVAANVPVSDPSPALDRLKQGPGGDELLDKVRALAADEVRLRTAQRAACMPLERRLPNGCLMVRVPDFGEDVHHPERLHVLSQRLVAQSRANDV